QLQQPQQHQHHSVAISNGGCASTIHHETLGYKTNPILVKDESNEDPRILSQAQSRSSHSDLGPHFRSTVSAPQLASEYGFVIQESNNGQVTEQPSGGREMTDSDSSYPELIEDDLIDDVNDDEFFGGVKVECNLEEFDELDHQEPPAAVEEPTNGNTSSNTT